MDEDLKKDIKTTNQFWEEAKKPGMENMSQEDLKKILADRTSKIAVYRGGLRRYYKLEAKEGEILEAVKEAVKILYPDYKTENPRVIAGLIGIFPVEKKIELGEDGHYWVRTILV